MATMYTGEEGSRIRILMHQHFFESRRKNLLALYVKLILERGEEGWISERS